MKRFSWTEAALVLLGLALLAAASWGVVAVLTPASAPSKKPAAGWELALKNLIRDQLELTLNASVVKKPKTQAALAALVKRLEAALPEALPYPLEVIVVNGTEVNAVTFPGGLVVVQQGLLEHASAEETAAVLAHEMGHVAHHDSADLIVKSLVVASIAALTTSSDAVQQAVQVLTQNAFSREVEDRADQFAIDLLTRARISPARLADFLAARKDSPAGEFVRENLPYLLDHPDRTSRIEKARQAPFKGPEEPLDVGWDAVQEELVSRR